MNRTISAKVLLSPEYRKLPASAKDLYVYSLLKADEYGFIEDIYKFLCTGGFKLDDLMPLYNKGFVIMFPNDSILIADWFRHTETPCAFSPAHDKEYEFVFYNSEGRFVELENLKEKRIGSRKQKAFIPPTLQEVRDYAASRKSPVDPVTFFNFFNTPNENGETWVDSKGQRVLNWKGKFVTWEKFKGGQNAGSNRKAAQQSAKGNPQSVSRFHIKYTFDGTAEKG